MSRYRAIEDSQTAHCCFHATVVDTHRPSDYCEGQFIAVCECFDMADAIKIAEALNAKEGLLS